MVVAAIMGRLVFMDCRTVVYGFIGRGRVRFLSGYESSGIDGRQQKERGKALKRMVT